jgi:endonuclease YncB( thermonuclease family)
MITYLHILALSLPLLMVQGTAAAKDITGKARVVDGDTIWIGETKIRLHEINAPEMKQTCQTSKGKERKCGELSKQALQRLVKYQTVTCKAVHCGCVR